MGTLAHARASARVRAFNVLGPAKAGPLHGHAPPGRLKAALLRFGGGAPPHPPHH